MNNKPSYAGSRPFGTTDASSLPDKKTPIQSGELFNGGREIIILHRNEEYHLRITRNGKLILTK